MSGEAFSSLPLMVLAPANSGLFLLAGSVPGAILMPAQCGHMCWVSPSGRRYMQATPCRYVCWVCAEGTGPVNSLKATPGARRELLDMGIPEEKISAMFNAAGMEEM